MLIVIGHCGVTINIPGYNTFVMPAFYLLSGLFFKDYGGIKSLTIKKINKILIPFLFFYIIGNIAFYAIKYIAPQYLITNARGILDIFNNRQFFNGPIWFLLCLFWCNIYFCLISIYIKRDTIRIATVCIIGAIGWWLGKQGIFVPLFLDVAMTALPLFAFGYYLKRSNMIYSNKWDRYSILSAFVFWLISLTMELNFAQRVSFHYNIIHINSYFTGVVSTLSILFLCKCINKAHFLSYIGRYSIVLLCVHHMIYRPVKVLLQTTEISAMNNEYSAAAVTLLLSALCIPLCIKYIPHFIAQKDLIKE